MEVQLFNLKDTNLVKLIRFISIIIFSIASLLILLFINERWLNLDYVGRINLKHAVHSHYQQTCLQVHISEKTEHLCQQYRTYISNYVTPHVAINKQLLKTKLTAPNCAYLMGGDSNVCFKKQQAIYQATQNVYQSQNKQGNNQYSDEPITYQSAQRSIDDNTQSPQPYQLSYQIMGLPTDKMPLLDKTISAEVDAIDQLYRQYLPIKQLAPIRFKIKLFKQLSEFEQAANTISQHGLAISESYYDPAQLTIYVAPLNHEQTLQQIKHQLIHLINASAFATTPVWLNEGMARLISGLQLSDDAIVIMPLQWQQLFIDQKVDVAWLIQAQITDWQVLQNQQLKLKSHAFVHFLMSHRGGQLLIKRLMIHLQKQRCLDNQSIDIVSQYPGGLAELQAKFNRWIRDGQYQALTTDLGKE